MEFLLAAIVLLLMLTGASWLLLELGSRCGRWWYWQSFRFHSWRRSLRFARYRHVSMLRCVRTREKPASFGRLRFTRSRAEQFGDGPPES